MMMMMMMMIVMIVMMVMMVMNTVPESIASSSESAPVIKPALGAVGLGLGF